MKSTFFQSSYMEHKYDVYDIYTTRKHIFKNKVNYEKNTKNNIFFTFPNHNFTVLYHKERYIHKKVKVFGKFVFYILYSIQIISQKRGNFLHRIISKMCVS